VSKKIMWVVKRLAWGACTALLADVEYSVVGHYNKQNIPADVITVGPVMLRNRTYIYITPNEYPVCSAKIYVYGRRVRITVLGPKTLKAFGVSKLITNPIVVEYKGEVALYVDDFSLKDIEELKKLVSLLKAQLDDEFKVFIMPAYSGEKCGNDDPEQISKASKDLYIFAKKKVDEVVLLGRPVIPEWAFMSKARIFPKILRTIG